jgi:hypothetical protein
MRLNIFNCSPRGRKSNTALLTEAFAEGFCANAEKTGSLKEENDFRHFFIAEQEDFRCAVEVFREPSVALTAFPVYVDAMPGIAKEFIEAIAVYRGQCASTRMVFLIQSGFPEETHTRPMAAYLLKMAQRLGTPCDGVIRMGGGESVRRRAESSGGRRLMRQYRRLGSRYASTGSLDEAILSGLAGPKRLPGAIVRLTLPLLNYLFWGTQLKRNDAYSGRFERPLM